MRVSEALVEGPASPLSRPHLSEWTYADLLAIPEDGPKCEIVEGNLVVSPLPSHGHQFAIGELLLLLKGVAPRDFGVLFDIDVDLGRHVFSSCSCRSARRPTPCWRC